MENKDKEITTTGKSTSQSRNRGAKGRTSRNKFRHQKSKGEKLDYRADSTNDISWYAANADLLRDSSSINFSEPTGSDVYGNVTTPTGDTNAPYLTRVPGVCSLRIMPAFGTYGSDGSVDIVNPITTASKQIYSFVRHANSGHSNYDAPDLMMYILAMGDIYSYIVWCQRLYAYSMMYDARNKYLPKALINANQVDFNDLLNHQADFRYWLNAFISKVTAFAVPATFSYMSRKAFLYKNLYIEGPSIKDQMYQLVPGAFLKFTLDSTDKGALVMADLPSSPAQLMTTQNVMDFGELLFKALWDQEDFGIMSGDILKAYGDNIIKLQGVDEVVPIMPLMDEVVLTQFKNATVLPTKHAGIDFFGLSQTENGELVSGITLPGNNTACAVAVPTDAVLSINAADVTPEMVMEATRFMIVPKTLDNEQVAMGTEIVTEVRYAITPDNPNIPFLSSDHYHSTEWNNIGYAQGLFAQSQFDYAPKFYFVHDVMNEQTGATTHNWGMLFDIDNYAILHYSDIRKVHEAALLNMLNVPSVAKI